MSFPRFLWPLAMLVGALSLSVSASEPHPSLPPPVIPDCLGVNIHFTDPKPGEMEMLAAAGFKWVRMDLTWASTERKQGEYDFSAYDRLVAKLDEFKIRAVFILDYGNPLYADPGDKQPFTSRAGTPEFREAFARWAVAAVSHFKGRGYLWEMWNEPNGGFWKPKADVEQYVALTKATGEALRTANLFGPKGEAFIGPATSTIDLPFLEACFKGGMLEFWDGVSVHPYRQNAPETVVEEYRKLRLLIHRYAPKDKVIPVISGEWGYSSAWTTQGKDEAARKEQQGKYLPRQFLTNIANDVVLSIWYDWHDDGTDPKEAEHRFGIVGNEYHAGRDPVYDPKPAYLAMKTLTEQLRGYRFNKVLYTARPKYSLLFAKEPDVRAAFWGKPEPEAPGLPGSAGTFQTVGYLGLQQPARNISAEGPYRLLLKVEDAPAYIRTEKPNDLWRLAAAWERMPLEIQIAPDEQRRTGFSVRNPLDHQVVIGDARGYSHSDKVSAILHPGALYESETSWPATRAENVFSLEGLSFRSLGGISQGTTTLSTAPIHLALLPAGSRAAYVLIQNPTGGIFSGRLHLVKNESAGSNAVELTGDGLDVSLRDGEKEKIVAIPLKQALPTSCHLDAWLDEGAQSAVIDASGSYHRVTFDTGDSAHPIAYSMTSEGDSKVAGRGSVEVDAQKEVPPYIDDSTFTVRYSFGAGWKFLTLHRSEIPWPSIPGTPGRFGLWVHGDGRGLQARVRFKDSTGQVFQSDAEKIDWQGWRFVVFPLQPDAEKTLAHWGGANDGVVHYPILWEAPLLLDNISRQPLEGEIAISMPTLID